MSSIPHNLAGKEGEGGVIRRGLNVSDDQGVIQPGGVELAGSMKLLQDLD